MFFCSRNLKGLWGTVAVLGMLLSHKVLALEKNEEALAMVSSAMDAFSNLEMDRAKEILVEALALAEELDNPTRAKIHTSLGVISISGFSDTPLGQTNFIQAICLDNETKVDPLYSTPEIDLVFSQSKELATPEKCEEFGIPIEGAGPSIKPCGNFEPLERLRRSYEIPFYVEVDGEFQYKVTSMVLHYAFDSGRYSDLDLAPRANGYGAKVECELHEIRRVNPREVTYYIEGFSSDGELVCGHGNEENPLILEMAEDAPLPHSIAGMNPEECIQCDEGDVECRENLMAKMRGNGKKGDSCTSEMDCKVDLICDPEMFVCTSEPIDREEEEDTETKTIGHKKFYVTLLGGTGGGYVNKSINIKKAAIPALDSDDNYDPRKIIGAAYNIEDASGQIVTVKNNAKGFSWAGIPVRLAIGVHITPKLSVEVSGRMDMFIISNSTPVSCWEAAGGDLNQMIVNAGNGLCRFDFDGNFTDAEREKMGKVAIAVKKVGETKADGTRNAQTLNKKKYQFAWLVNARARYRYLTMGPFVGTVFGGVGYGHIQYRVKDTASGNYYFPMPGMVDIEIGAGAAYYFSRNAGLILDVPLDFIVGDGFAFNIDINLGISVGF